MWAEAQGESKRGQEGVAHVILNRARQSGKDVCAVTKQSGQFRRSNPKRDFVVSLDHKDPTNGATSFQRKNMTKWGKLHKYVTIGKHTFYGK